MGLQDTIKTLSSQGQKGPKGKIGEHIVESLCKFHHIPVTRVHAGNTDFKINGMKQDVKFRDMLLKGNSPFPKAKSKGIPFIYVVARKDKVEIHHSIPDLPDSKNITEAYDEQGIKYRRFSISWEEAEKYSGEAAVKESEKDISGTLRLIEPVQTWCNANLGKTRVVYKEGDYKNPKGPRSFFSKENSNTVLLFIENNKIVTIHAYPASERNNIQWIPFQGNFTYEVKKLDPKYIFSSIEELRREFKSRL